MSIITIKEATTWTVPNSSELSSIDVPTKSKDKHLSDRESANSCNRLTTACYIHAKPSELNSPEKHRMKI